MTSSVSTTTHPDGSVTIVKTKTTYLAPQTSTDSASKRRKVSD
jgi:hypothetical protein